MTAVKSLLQQAQDSDFWKSLNPALSVDENLAVQSSSALTVEPEQMKNLLLNLKKEGYFQIDSVLLESEVLRLSEGIERLRQAGWPPPFAFIYDEFWQTFCRLSSVLSTVLGQDYRQLPDFWAWYVGMNDTEKGWGQHRDKTQNTLLPDGMPKSLTIWVALSDATPLNGCIYVLPATFDPNYGCNSSRNEVTNVQDIRALPVVAGSILCWNQAVLHWGGRSSERAPHPRISIAFEFQRGDVEPYNTPLLNPSVLPNFHQRLGLIGKQILQYQHMYHLSVQLTEIAMVLTKMYHMHNLTGIETSALEGFVMDNQASELREKVRQQFDAIQYPKIPIDKSPKNDYNVLYFHNLVTPYYLRNQKVIDATGKVILDAGCGSGYKALILAQANPGAKIVGIDIAEESVKLANQRLKYHGFENTEFHALSIEDLSKLEIEFDYINCDEVLYLFPEPSTGLQAMKSVLKPNGIIRTNLHSLFQRFNYFRAQEVFKMMGLMEHNPQDMEIEIVLETMKALKDGVDLKNRAWNPEYEGEEGKVRVLMNYLLQGDKGYTIPELFTALKAANLEFISMVNWWQWDLMALFKELDNLPVFLGMSLPELAVEERLHLFELLHPIHRLLDIWCGHPDQTQPSVPIAEWTTADWQGSLVYIHPQLKTSSFRENLLACITELKIFNIADHLPLKESFVAVDSATGICLLPLLESSQQMRSLVKRWQQVRPIHPATLEPTDAKEAFQAVQQLLTMLESLGYVLLERQS